jgi:methylated-DNA-[protein]-cysteine S-methyltransferase
MVQEVYTSKLMSPLGWVGIQASNFGVIRISYEDEAPIVQPSYYSEECRDQLDAYFNGDRSEFDLTFDLAGTDFQKRVWNELKNLSFGETITYGELAVRMGNPFLVRAVGRANGANPLNIVVPCHRVIGKNGSLIGYGGGLWRKQWLLRHEAKIAGKNEQYHLFEGLPDDGHP